MIEEVYKRNSVDKALVFNRHERSGLDGEG